VPTRKLNPLAEADNLKLCAEICIWIDENIDSDIGWKELASRSDLSHSDLQFLFGKCKHTTPMTYIRQRREESKKAKPIFTMRHSFLANKSQ
jgi:AraC-like DNA-binding protein